MGDQGRHALADRPLSLEQRSVHGVAELFHELEAEWFSDPPIVEPASSEIPDGALPKVTTLLVEAGRIVHTH